MANRKYDGLEVAIIGMACRIADVENVEELWTDLVSGEELLTTYNDNELLASGVSEKFLSDPNFVRTLGSLKGKEYFDRSFFGYSDEESLFMDPQIRIFHELCWEALEVSGYAGLLDKKRIGLIASASTNDIWKAHSHKRKKSAMLDPYYLSMLTSHTFLSSLVSYKLGLKGPVHFVDTACSSSLVAIHSACRSLLTRECDIMLAGGISVRSQKEKGYLFQEGMIRSKDGHCRSFDKDASGTASGEGGGVVVLKRLNDALNDKDYIHAIIKGSAINNDGRRKVGFTAPSVEGQIECIKMAQQFAKVPAESIGYVEAHGTATQLGDPIEIKALIGAFGEFLVDKSCAIGSIKSNIGHLDASAGVAGLIKASLCLFNRKIPASLHFNEPNPEIPLDKSPFFVNNKLRDFTPNKQYPLRAAVSSFGMGGTNAHLILEEAPDREYVKCNSENRVQIITLSAKSEKSLEFFHKKMLDYLSNNLNLSLEDISYTLQVGRKHFQHRKAYVSNNIESLLKSLSNPLSTKSYDREVVLVLSGQGTLYKGATRDLYFGHSVFKKYMDIGFSQLESMGKGSLKNILLDNDNIGGPIQNPSEAQPLLFIIEYALFQATIMSGVKWKYMVGHSLGEFVCATLDNIMTFEDALKIVVRRGELISEIHSGMMVAAALDRQEATKYLNKNVSLAAINDKQQVVYSGDLSSMNDLIEKFDELGIANIPLKTTHAYHSHMMEPIVEKFRVALEEVSFNEKVIPTYFSGTTGDKVTAKEVSAVDHWVNHLLNCVRFDDCIGRINSESENLFFLEIGIGDSLSKLLKRRDDKYKIASGNLVRNKNVEKNDVEYFFKQIALLWEKGGKVEWNDFFRENVAYHIPLPTYSFDKSEFLSEVSLSNLFEPSVMDFSQEELKPKDDLENHHESSEIRTETEKYLVDICQRLFTVKEISVHDSFFDLGGDSLKAMALLREINKNFGTALQLSHIFNCLNLKEMAVEVDKQIHQNRTPKQYRTII